MWMQPDRLLWCYNIKTLRKFNVTPNEAERFGLLFTFD